MMKHMVVGLLAHVDAGKTTLAEAMLYRTGAIRSAGRVDHGDTYLDFEEVERRRGITVFSKQAHVHVGDTDMSLIDAPGHVDFGAEAERTMGVLDCAVLVIAANEPVRGHTKTLWRLLERFGVPTVVFVNKMDLAHKGEEELEAELRQHLSEGCMRAASLDSADAQEQIAMCDEGTLEEYLESGRVSRATLRSLVSRRLVVPCVFGSALRMEGIDELLDVLVGLPPIREPHAEFGARAYKVSHGANGERIVWLRVTGAALHAKMQLEGTCAAQERWADKVDQIRVYNGAKYEVVREVEAGAVCAVTGLDHVMPGDGLGCEGKTPAPAIVPVLDFAVEPVGCDAHALHAALKAIEEEDPLLHVVWEEQTQQIFLQLMGAIQQEIIEGRLLEDWGLHVSFGPGRVLYKETVAESVRGIGHFEPLRHYAEVHVDIEPLERGAGVEFGTVCMEDDLDRNWQRLILTNAMERPHKGVLIGAPLTDVRITLVGGRAHAKHTEGGDFRQATYRAIRQGLMQAQSILLEPWYRFELAVPSAKVGRALSDLQRMYAEFEPPEVIGDEARIVGCVPVATIQGYALEVAAYSSGAGFLHLEADQYRPCHNAAEVVDKAGYEPESDLAHTPDSVFCSHGAGYTVKWFDVAEHAHVQVRQSRRRPFVSADATFFGVAER